MGSAQYVVVGAGFAGASTAYHLARAGARDIVILEQERTAGVHSSGRNASMIRQVVSDPQIGALTHRGARFLIDPPGDWPEPVPFAQNGSLLLGCHQDWDRLRHDAEQARQEGIETEAWSQSETVGHVEVLEGADFEGAVWCATDGVVDIHALLASYLNAAASLGCKIRFGTLVQQIESRHGKVTCVVTADGRVATECVVNAGGAWAQTVAEMAGALRVPLLPSRRHLFQSVELPWVKPKWPFVWHVSHNLYFRPEDGGLLLCACDQDEMPAGDPPVNEAIGDLLARKLGDHLPGLSGISIKTKWAGLRTLTPDGRFVIGWDPRLHGFFWVAGLGGHGVTASFSVGELAAKLILGEDLQEGRFFSPARFESV